MKSILTTWGKIGECGLGFVMNGHAVLELIFSGIILILASLILSPLFILGVLAKLFEKVTGIKVKYRRDQAADEIAAILGVQ